ncbi:MAG: 50S ribosomal protein L17 [Flavobacteriaceae bacterium]|nr:50S ribosomal protein L17 [Flavobacteriaceae bacterium]
MRHGKKIAHLGRTASHRKAMLANMASSLIEHKRINTTVARAKALKRFVEPLITKAKSDTTHNRRVVFSSLRNKYAVTELFSDISEKIGDRPGGYTRIVKLGNRMGDNADMAMIELVDFNDTYETAKPKKKRSRRRGGSKPQAAEAAAPEEVVVEETAETQADEAAVEDNATTEEPQAESNSESSSDDAEDAGDKKDV